MTRAPMKVLLVGVVACLVATIAVAQTTRTLTLTGTVVETDGTTLAVKLASGEVRVFTPPADRKFIVDGKELTLGELQPGTKLTATVTETATEVTKRTVETIEGKVWFASGPTVILTLPSGENKAYTVKDDAAVKFYDGSGAPITVFDLRKGMNIKATKITLAPSTEFASATQVVGTSPGRAEAGAATAGSTGAGAGAAATTGSTRAAPAAGTTAGATAAAPAAAPKKLPKTGSPLPLVGLSGVVSLAGAIGLTIRRRRRAAR